MAGPPHACAPLMMGRPLRESGAAARGGVGRLGVVLLGQLLALAPAVCALDLRVTGVSGSEASNIVNGEELGLQFDTLHNALATANSGDVILVDPGQWDGVQDATLFYSKTLYIRSTAGALVTALRGSNGAPDEERVAALVQCAGRSMPALPAVGQDVCGVQDGSRLSLQDDINADPDILASGARLRELYGAPVCVCACVCVCGLWRGMCAGGSAGGPA